MAEISFKTVATVVAGAATIVAAVITIDTRYAQTAALETYKSTTERKFEEWRANSIVEYKELSRQNRYLVDQLRKQQLEDEIFKSEIAQADRRLTSIELATLSRNNRNIEEINSRWKDYVPGGGR